jgi:hypothetical protein
MQTGRPAVQPMHKTSTSDVAFLVLQFLRDEGFKDTVVTFEQEVRTLLGGISAVSYVLGNQFVTSIDGIPCIAGFRTVAAGSSRRIPPAQNRGH